MRLYYHIGRFFEKKERYRLAIKFYNLVKNNQLKMLHYGRGHSYESLEVYDKAVVSYKKALVLEKNEDSWYFRCAESLISIDTGEVEKEKNAIEAFSYLEQAIIIKRNKINETLDFVKKSLAYKILETYESKKMMIEEEYADSIYFEKSKTILEIKTSDIDEEENAKKALKYIKKALKYKVLPEYKNLESKIISNFQDHWYFREAKIFLSLEGTNNVKEENAKKALNLMQKALDLKVLTEYKKLELEIINNFQDRWYFNDAKILLSQKATPEEKEENAQKALNSVQKALEYNKLEEYIALEDEIINIYTKAIVESIDFQDEKIVCKILITMVKNIDKQDTKLLLKSRVCDLNTESCSSYILLEKSEKNSKNQYVVTFIVNMSQFDINKKLLLTNLDLYLQIKEDELRIKSNQEYKDIFTIGNYDFVPYSTKYKYLSFMWIRKKPLLNKVTQKKKIIFLLHRIDFKGGVTKVTINLVNALAEYGYDVTLSALVCTNSANKTFVSPLVAFDYIALSSHKNKYLPQSVYSAEERVSQYYMNRLESYFNKKSVDIVNIPIYGGEIHQALLRTIPSHIDIIISDHAGWRYEFYLNFLKGDNSALNLQKLENTQYIFNTLNRVSAVHLVNPLIEKAFQNITQDKILIASIPNIIPHNTKLSKPSKSLWDRDKKIILIGSLIKVKNFETAIRAFSKIVEEYNEWSLEIYGEGSEKENLNNLIYKLKVEHCISLKGYSSNINVVLQNSSIHLSVSHQESFGLTMVEAMQVGTIVISTNNTIGARYIIDHNETGLLAKNNNVENVLMALKSCMSMFQDKNIKLLEIQENAFNKSILYDNENITKKWSKVIDSFSDKSR